MNNRQKIGALLTLVFTLISLIQGLYFLFSGNNVLAHTGLGWLSVALILTSFVLSLSLLADQNNKSRFFNVALIITATLSMLHFNLSWLVFFLTLSLVGCLISFKPANEKSPIKIGK